MVMEHIWNIKVYRNKTWETIESLQGISNEYALQKYNDKLYLVYQNNSYDQLNIGTISLNQDKIEYDGFKTISTNGNIQSFANPRIAKTSSGLYVMTRNFRNGNKVNLIRFDDQAKTTFQELSSPKNVDAFDMMAYNDSLYFVSGQRGSTTELEMQVYRSENDIWEVVANSKISAYLPKLVEAQGNLYVLTSVILDQSTKNLRVYTIENKNFLQEGLNVDNDGSAYSFMASKNSLFAGYSLNGKAMIKQKNTANPLISLTVTPPTKISYYVGDTISLNGLKVVANYAKNQRELSANEYTITNLKTDVAGDFIATVSFAGVDNVFNYKVFEKDDNDFVEQETVWDELSGNLDLTFKKAIDISRVKQIRLGGRILDVSSYLLTENGISLYETLLKDLNENVYDLEIQLDNGEVFLIKITIKSVESTPQVPNENDQENQVPSQPDAQEKPEQTPEDNKEDNQAPTLPGTQEQPEQSPEKGEQDTIVTPQQPDTNDNQIHTGRDEVDNNHSSVLTDKNDSKSHSDKQQSVQTSTSDDSGLFLMGVTISCAIIYIALKFRKRVL